MYVFLPILTNLVIPFFVAPPHERGGAKVLGQREIRADAIRGGRAVAVRIARVVRIREARRKRHGSQPERCRFAQLLVMPESRKLLAGTASVQCAAPYSATVNHILRA